MKKNILKLFLIFVTVIAFSSCLEEEGTTPGGDSEPIATLYIYKADAENYNPENDVFVRVAINDKVKECYYLAQKAEDRSTQIEQKGEDAYMDYVITEGTKISEFTNYKTADFYVKGLKGKYTISVVAVGGESKSLAGVNFTGYDWVELGKGIFTSSSFGFSEERDIQKLRNGNLYQVKSAYKEGWNLRFTVNEDNSIAFDKQEIGIVHKKYGMMSFGPQLNGSKKEGKNITLVGKLTVAAGSFGEFKETIVLPE